jgi:hypothetical protein
MPINEINIKIFPKYDILHIIVTGSVVICTAVFFFKKGEFPPFNVI